jgi:hypothetical protein
VRNWVKIAFGNGILSMIQEWEMLSKKPFISPSYTILGYGFDKSICSNLEMASQVPRPSWKP